MALPWLLLGEPKLLILDEPTNGLDPAGMQEMRSLLAHMPEQTGATVLISSHLLSEMEQTVTKMGIIDHGKMLFEGPLQQLQQHSRGRILDMPKGAAILQHRGIRFSKASKPGVLQLAPLSDAALAELVACPAEGGAGVVGLSMQSKNLEDIFLSLTQSHKEGTLC